MMLRYARRLPNRLRAGLLLLSGLLIADLIAVRTASSAPATQATGNFHVTVSQGAVSLKAHDTPLTRIFRELGRQAEFEVVSKLNDDETVTLHFDRLPLEAAIKRLAKNAAIVYSKDPNTCAPKIARVLLLAEGQAAPTSPSAEEARHVATRRARELRPIPDKTPTGTKDAAPRPQPFEFEFDPSQYEQPK